MLVVYPKGSVSSYLPILDLFFLGIRCRLEALPHLLLSQLTILVLPVEFSQLFKIFRGVCEAKYIIRPDCLLLLILFEDKWVLLHQS